MSDPKNWRLGQPCDMCTRAPSLGPSRVRTPGRLTLSRLTACPLSPTDESLYEAPEPIFTSNSSCSGLGGCHLFLTTVPVLWSLLGS